jgi:hypothetical protein
LQETPKGSERVMVRMADLQWHRGRRRQRLTRLREKYFEATMAPAATTHQPYTLAAAAGVVGRGNALVESTKIEIAIVP